MTSFKKMLSLDGYPKVFSHLTHRDLLDTVLNYSRETSWMLSSTHVLKTLFQEVGWLSQHYIKEIQHKGSRFKQLIKKKLPQTCSFQQNLKELQ